MILEGNCLDRLKELPDESVQCCVTSPPYWGLRDYGNSGQIGLESAFEDYVRNIVGIFEEVRRVLKSDGTLWLNLGDCYATGAGKVGNSPGGGKQGEKWRGSLQSRNNSKHVYSEGIGPRTQPNRLPQIGLKPKDLVGIPWRVAFALQASGWFLRQDIIWSKTNPMPESVTDRCTKSHEYIFLLTKSKKYYFDHVPIKEPASRAHEGQGTSTGKFGADPSKRNRRSVWTVQTRPFKGAHFATFPPDLIRPCVLAGCPEGGTILDPFFGAGTTGLVALQEKRRYLGIELNPEYIRIAQARLDGFTRQGELL